MRYDALVPCFAASFVGDLIATAWGIKHEHHVIHKLPEMTAGNVGKVLLLAVLFALVGILYCQVRHGIHQFCRKYIPNLIVRGMLGGAVIVALVYLINSRDYIGRGLPMLEKAFEGSVPPFAFLGKILFTAITMGTGFRGGEAIPMFVVGATLGNALSSVVGLPVSFLAALGLIGLFCGVAQAPLACFLLSLEFFEGKGMVFFFLVCLVSYLFSGHHSIYPTQEVYEPKGRLLGLPQGTVIADWEKNKEQP